MTLMLAFTSSPEGAAALEQGRAVATRLGTDVVVFDLDRVSHADDRHVDAPAEHARPDERWFAPAHTAPAPAEDLVDTAQELGVEAIVVGIRRRSPVGKLIMGSQAQRIILGSPVPVLTVKAKAAGE